MNFIIANIQIFSILNLSLTAAICYSVQPQKMLISNTSTNGVQLELVSPLFGFKVPDDLGLPDRREAGGTR